MSVPHEPLDILVSGSDEPRPRRRAAVAAVAAVVLVLVAAGCYADLRRQRSEFAALTGCADRARAAATDAAGPVDSMAGYVRPSLAFALPSSADGLYGMVARVAAGAGPGLQEARAACADVAVLGWHDELRAARGAQLGYLDAELDLLRETAGDGRAWFDDPADLPQLHRDATAALSAAAPHLPWT